MEGARPADGHPLPHAAAGEDALDPVFHFLAGAPGKGEEQDAARIGALLDEIRDPMRKRLSFAGTRPRDDQQGAAARAIVRGGGLVFVEGCKTLGWLHGFELRTIPKLKMIMISFLPAMPHAAACRASPCNRKRCLYCIRSHLDGYRHAEQPSRCAHLSLHWMDSDHGTRIMMPCFLSL